MPFEQENVLRKFLVYGYFGGRNFGDELMLLGYLNRHVSDGDEVAIITPDGTVPEHLRGRVRAAYRKSPGGFLKGVRWASDFVLCGGTVFHDAYPDDRHASYRKNLVAVATLLRAASLLGARVHLAAIGLGPICRSLTRLTARQALAAARQVEVRDERSVEEARKLGREVALVKDLAHDAALAPPEGQPRRGLAVSVVSTDLISTVDTQAATAFYEGLAGLLARYQQRSGEPLRILAICVGAADSDMGFADTFARQVRAAGAGDVTIEPFDGDPYHMRDRIAASRGIVAMRYHAATVAEKIATPTFWLAYQRKVIDGAEELGVPAQRVGSPDGATLAAIETWLDTL